jgi:hypothetical protein
VRIGWLRLERLRADPARVDRWTAVVFTVLAQWEIWSGSGSALHRLGASALALAITVPIAVRRRWPAVVGTVVPSLTTLEYAIFGGSSIRWRTSSRSTPLRSGRPLGSS